MHDIETGLNYIQIYVHVKNSLPSSRFFRIPVS